MISLAVTLLLSHATLRLDDPIVMIATDDVWVYPNAPEPGTDESFRVWGVGGRATAEKPTEAESFGYGYLRFVIPATPAGKKLVGAWMVLKPTGTMKVDKNVKDYPLEVRPLVGKFSEKTFEHGMTATVYPGENIFGTGLVAPVAGSTDEKDLEIRVDLMAKKSTFAEMYGKAVGGDRAMFFALTSKYDASELGREGIYQIYTRDKKEENLKPRLVLNFE